MRSATRPARFVYEFSENALVAKRLPSRRDEAAAPRLWACEVRNSVLMGFRRKRITYADALEFLQSIKELPVRLTDPVSYDGVFTPAGRHGLSVYDAACLDLAVREGLPLASLDNALCKAALNANVALFPP
jgi:predicted nucleic acid-binding protein